MNPPVFSRKIPVTQMDARGIGAIVVLCTVYSALMMMGAAWLFDEDATGWRAVLSTVALLVLIAVWMVGLLVVAAAWIWVEERWLASVKRRPKAFSASAQVDVDERGLSIDGLGHVQWIDVLTIEGIPDSDNYLVVHTRPFNKLMLTAPVDELAPVINHYLALRSDAGAMATATGILQSRAIVFCWRCFLAWIVAGYALAAAAGVALVLYAPDVGFLKTVVVLCVLLPMIAWLVWAIPFAQIGLLSHSRVRAFELDGTRLRSTDGAWQIDLMQTRISHRHARGLGYEFGFLAVRPKTGRNLDLLLEGGADQEALLEALSGRGLLPQANPER
ncbi:hypothetical protein [Variovorax sp. IB41]|uniref:hypothetical protein n=1 Tax=Variovorax sp. IB41 TaxID=2779370 RepID=UPI0018E6EF09|nr:hypothetical protein [Variovorax sp. IB41]MBJ2157305.1 hypothetical protein [Variovorax sp. IB41]